MGGYGSGRRVRYSLTSECLPLDTSFLLKRKMLTGGKQGGELTFTSSTKDIKGKVTETKHNLYCLVERYGEEEGDRILVASAGGSLRRVVVVGCVFSTCRCLESRLGLSAASA